MRTRFATAIFFGLAFLAGVLLGTFVQRAVGLGNLLRAAGVAYPTRTSAPAPAAPPTPTPLPVIPTAYRGDLALFILAGQSNMSGRAPVPPGEEVEPRAFMFGNDYRWDQATEPLDRAIGQVDPVARDGDAGFGPSVAFARASLAYRPQTAIGLIPCARGASSISEWQRDLSDQTLYGACLKRARAASPLGQLAGVLFFQGEQDAVDATRYPKYHPLPGQWSQLFAAFVHDFRADLGAPDLPVVFAQLGPTPQGDDFPNWELVKQQQRSTQFPYSAMIVTDDLQYFDGLHFTVDSYRIIGSRFAQAYWDLVEQGFAR